jgi:hypothetical protein
MWHRMSLALLLGLVTFVATEAQDWRPRRDPPRDFPPERGRREQPNDYRHTWVYWIDGGGRFERVRGDQWVQHRRSGRPMHYREVARTPEYIELYDAESDLPIRLYDNVMYQNPNRQGWGVGFEGQWQ